MACLLTQTRLWHAAEIVPGSSRCSDTGPAATRPSAQEGIGNHAPLAGTRNPRGYQGRHESTLLSRQPW